MVGSSEGRKVKGSVAATGIMILVRWPGRVTTHNTTSRRKQKLRRCTQAQKTKNTLTFEKQQQSDKTWRQLQQREAAGIQLDVCQRYFTMVSEEEE